MKRFFHIHAAALAVVAALGSVPAPARATAGTDGPVYALLSHNSRLIAAGNFSLAGNAAAPNIAAWDGMRWAPLGAGLDGPCYALAQWDSVLYAGGAFSLGVARWNGATWETAGGGVTGGAAAVRALFVDGSSLLVGGQFAFAGTTPANGLARWNGATWTTLGGIRPGIVHDIRALVVVSGTTYVGGVLHFPGSTRPSEGTLARATPFVLSNHAGSVNADAECAGCASVDALFADNGTLFVGGAFTGPGTVLISGSAYNVFALVGATAPIGLADGATTPSVASGGGVHALAADNGAMFVGGNVETIRGISALHIARWDGVTWSSVGGGTDAPVRALVVHAGALYAGGNFVTAEGDSVRHVARWDGTNWSGLVDAPVPTATRTWGGVKRLYRR